jgi:DHA2 family multidrug resistance protein
MTHHPILGVLGVLLGASIATCIGRLISVGLMDIRGALHLGAEEASWIGTAFNAAMMFVGPFSVYLGGLLGARRVLLVSAGLFTLVGILLPFAPTLPILLVLLVLAGLTAGTFYPLTLSFVLRSLPMRYVLLGIAMYAMDILVTTTFATSLEAWFTDHLSWRWIFWIGAAMTPLMMILIYFGMPWQPLPQPKEGQPRPNWRGFLYASFGFSLLYIALDQGQRLDWMNSGTIVGLAVSGVFLLLAAFLRRLTTPNPLINFRFIARRNTLLLGAVVIFFRFAMLATVVVIPSYLASVKGYLPLQTGPVLLEVAMAQAICGMLAIYLLKYVDARLIITLGFALVALACLMNATLSSAWAGDNFRPSQAVMAIGLALAFNGMVGAIILEVVNTGALTRPVDALTFAGYFKTLRLLGGEIGIAFLQHFISAREQFHSNALGLGVQLGQPTTNQQLFALSAGLAHRAPGLTTAMKRAAEILGLQIRQQAFTLAITDSFLLVAWSVVCCIVVVSFMQPVPTQYQQVVSAPTGNARQQRSRLKELNMKQKKTQRTLLENLMPMLLCATFLGAQHAACAQAAVRPTTPVPLTLPKAIELALKQNRSLQLAHLAVTDSEHKKEIARSAYFAHVKNESSILYVTELAGVEISAGAFGVPAATGQIPSKSLFIGQGSDTAYTSGSGLAQPLTQMFKIHESNRAAVADINTAKIRVSQTENEIALRVRQIYYSLVIAQITRQAATAEIAASQLKVQESADAVAQGRALELADLESHAALLDSRQTALTLQFQIHNLNLSLDDLLGLPLSSQLQLDTDINSASAAIPSRKECLRIAQNLSPEIRGAQQAVIKARAGMAAAKDAFIPDITGLARYSYQSGVPLLVHNFGTFGVTVSYDLFDGGRRNAELKDSRTLLSEAELTLARAKDEVTVQVETAYDKLEQSQSMVGVAEEVLGLRTEAARLADRQFEQDILLASVREESHAKAALAKAAFVEASLGLALSQAELKRTIGQLPQEP